MNRLENVESDFSEGIKKKNLKAHLLYAEILKDQGDYEKSLKIARKGRKIAESKLKEKEKTEFDSIIAELLVLNFNNSTKSSETPAMAEPNADELYEQIPFTATSQIALNNTFSALGSGGVQTPQRPSVVPAAPKPVKPVVKETFEPMQSSDLSYPFSSKLDFCLVCNQCFSQVTPGERGIKQSPRWKHPCPKDILIVRERKGGGKWCQIRPRDRQREFWGPFRLCRHYMDGQPCKALSCSFAHSELEAELWQMDREEQLDIIEFIQEQRQLRNTGQTFVPVQQPQKAVPVTPTPKVLSTQALEAAAPFAFPMRKTHEFRITCGGCIAPTLDGKAFAMRPLPEHKCRQDVLLVRPKGASAWHRVRSRQKHRPFKGKYRMCFRMGCTGSDACQYAHNDEERFLWTQEKDGEFNVDEFLISNRASPSERVVTIQDVLQRHPGPFNFHCKACFYGSPSRISWQSNQHCTSGHSWAQNKLLFHHHSQGSTKLFIPIQARPFVHAGAFFLFCHRQRYCRSEGCKFAHSPVERDVWRMERDGQGSREHLVLLSNPQAPQAPQQRAAPTPVQPAQNSKGSGCPFSIHEICQLCWSNGTMSFRNGSKDACTSKHAHKWFTNITYLLVPANKVIKPLPQRLPTNNHFMMCHHLKRGYSCQMGCKCQFAHSEEEINVWKWMVNNQVMTLGGLVAASQKNIKVVRPKVTPPAPEVKPVPTPVIDLPASVIYCQYCCIELSTSADWEDHCASEEHIASIHSDDDHQWNYRPPPWVDSELELCMDHENGEMCPHSGKPDMSNLCEKAHSEEELEEWKERLEWRRMKETLAQTEGAGCYADMLSSEYSQADQGSKVIVDDVPDVHITCSTPLKSMLNEKHTQQSWVFKVTSKGGKKLHKIALLQNKDRLHFWLKTDKELISHHTMNGEDFLERSDSSVHQYRVKVCFNGGLFGSFSQWVTFDFGGRPVAVRKLNMDLVTEEVKERVQALRKNLKMDRWTTDNSTIRLYGSQNNADDQKLLTKYKAPNDVAEVVTQDSVGTAINQHNYVHKMHSLLRLEEFTRARLIASYNLQTRLELINTIFEGSMVSALPGHLFAKVPLTTHLSADSNAGQLILDSVQSALLKPSSIRSDVVYEAMVLNQQNFNLEGKGRDYIYLSLSACCVKELSLENGDHLDVDIQFQMDRLPFASMHETLDALHSTDILFPNVAAAPLVPKPKSHLRLGVHLNKEQSNILNHIIRKVSFFPMSVCGPFGTGKTESLAQSAMALIEEQPQSRVLICTHSNSAADLYILRHLSKKSSIKLCRIVYTGRWVRTVPPIVRNYCFESPERDRFVEPSRAEVEQCQIVVTTLSTASSVVKLGLRGHFTHILIDEAAQALECEAIKPLVLANARTCIVLAGDPMQMQPKVYSAEAQRQNFQASLLERLYRLYGDMEKHCRDSVPPSLLLRENYRTDSRLLRFISEVFYGHAEMLIARSELEVAQTVAPMAFYVSKGEETIDAEGTSFYNEAEIQEMVDQVAALYKYWPHEWGERRAELIGVISPYQAQVQRIRFALRRHRELKAVNVERVDNVQGKEFRAVFISTVRSSNLSLPSVEQDVSECSGHAGQLGFLSDSRLLNTAITRTKSFVGVVGNPVVLCGVGSCKTLWRSFLKTCRQLHSISPDTVTMEQIRESVKEMAAKAPNRGLLSIKPRPAQEPIEPPVRVFDESGSLEELGCLEQLPSVEDILLQLTKESARSNVKEQVSISHMDISLQAGHAVISFSEEPKMNAIPAQISETWLQEQFQIDPLHFVRCLVLQGLNHAQVLHPDNPTHHIRLSVPQHIPVLSGDEVAVQLTGQGVGKVVSLIHRPFEPEGQLLVCCQSDQAGSLRPLNSDLPIIHAVVPSIRVEKVEKGVLPVYAYTASGQLMFDHYEPSSGLNQLWVVHCLGWRQGLSLGLVLGALPQAIDIERCMLTLHLDHRMPNDFMPSTLQQMTSALSMQSASSEAFDYRSTLTFTIQDPSDRALDCAISFTDIKDTGCFLLGLHVADVAQMVPKGSALDLEAELRGALIPCPLSTNCLMLPDEISHDQCCFVSGKDRRALTIFITIDGNAKVRKVVPKRTLVRSNHSLNPEEVQKIINATVSDRTELRRSLVLLSKTTEMWRYRRLGNDAHSSENTPGNRMIREVQITAGMLIGRSLLQKKPQSTPILIQALPNYAALDSWKEQHAVAASNAVHLSRAFHKLELCECTGPCAKIQAASILDPKAQVHIPKSREHQLLKDPQSEILSQPSVQPQVLLAERALVSLQQPEQYVCSADVPPRELHHFNLNASPLVSFFCPLHSHIDLVTQRILVAYIDDAEEAYSTKEVRALCARANAVSRRERSHRLACGRVQVCRALMQNPTSVEAVVQEVNGSSVRLVCGQPITEQLSLLAIGAQTAKEIDIAFRQVQLTFELRIVDLKQIQGRIDLPIELSSDWNLLSISKTEWQHLLWTAVRGHRPEIERVAVHSNPAPTLLGTVTCNLKLQAGSVLSLQLTSGLHNGTLAPTVQLVHLTPSLSMCAEHRLHAVDCFVGSGKIDALGANYADVAAYQEAWHPVLAVEAAGLSQASTEGVIIQNVKLDWDKQKATFQLPESLCKDFSISYGFACVRYQGIRSSQETTYTWVGHCLVTQVASLGQGFHQVHLEMKQSNSALPSVADLPMATVEWIPKHWHIQSAELTLDQLPEASALVKNIVLGKPPGGLDSGYKKRVMNTINKPLASLPSLVEAQAEVLSACLQQPFSCVQGSASAGKTLLSLHLALRFVLANRSQAGNAAVLVCVSDEEAVAKTSNLLMRHELTPRVAQLTRSGVEFNARRKIERESNEKAEIFVGTPFSSPSLRQCDVNVTQVIIDDSHLGSELASLSALVFTVCRHVILFGDVLALKPFSCLSDQPSLFMRYKALHMQLQCPPMAMHRGISRFATELFDLQPMLNPVEEKPGLKIWPGGRHKPCAFLDVAHAEKDVLVAGGSLESLENTKEASIAGRVVRQLMFRFKVAAADLAVLSPYEGQVQALRKALAKQNEVHVCSVSEAAGKSWDMVIVSLVRSSPEFMGSSTSFLVSADCQRERVGRIAEPHVMYTALTRARKGLILIGDRCTLARSPTWCALIQQFDHLKQIIPADDFLATSKP